MMPNQRWLLLALVAAVLPSPSVLAVEGPVEATALYRQAFGAPPVTGGGTCRAAVVFLPGVGVSGAPDKLSALPLFAVNSTTVTEEAARMLVEGPSTEVRGLKLPRLFPEGSRLSGVSVEGRAAVVRVRPGGPGPAHPLAVQALAHTLCQFEGIGAVVLEIEGRAPFGPEAPQEALLEAPAPPRLLDVTAPVRKEERPSEIDVLFDRPVEVVMISIRSGPGRLLRGKTYASMFDMAVVFRPDDPKELRENLPLDVRWSVRDKVGRKADGTRAVPLRVVTRPE